MSTYGSTPIYGRRPYGLKGPTTATNPYLMIVEPMNVNTFTYAEFTQFTTTGTAQAVTAMRPLSSRTNTASPPQPCSCYLTAAAAASQAVVNINQDPGIYTAYTFNANAVPRTANNVIAASDNVVYQYPDGTWEANTVASVSTLAITLTNNLATGGLAIGSPIFFYGILTDVNPYDGLVHPKFNLYAPANPTTINLGSEGYPWIGSFNRGHPLLLTVTNATNAVVMERMTAAHSDRGSPYAW